MRRMLARWQGPARGSMVSADSRVVGRVVARARVRWRRHSADSDQNGTQAAPECMPLVQSKRAAPRISAPTRTVQLNRGLQVHKCKPLGLGRLRSGVRPRPYFQKYTHQRFQIVPQWRPVGEHLTDGECSLRFCHAATRIVC